MNDNSDGDEKARLEYDDTQILVHRFFSVALIARFSLNNRIREIFPFLVPPPYGRENENAIPLKSQE